MSMIHSCWVLLAPRSAPSFGSAGNSTKTSMETSSVGSAGTAGPARSRRPAPSAPSPIAVLALVTHTSHIVDQRRRDRGAREADRAVTRAALVLNGIWKRSLPRKRQSTASA